MDAPLFEELPLTLECQVVELTEEGPGGVRIVGQVLNMSADESILGRTACGRRQGPLPLL